MLETAGHGHGDVRSHGSGRGGECGRVGGGGVRHAGGGGRQQGHGCGRGRGHGGQTAIDVGINFENLDLEVFNVGNTDGEVKEGEV